MNHSSADQSNRSEMKETETETEIKKGKILPISHYHSINFERDKGLRKIEN